MTIEQVAKLFFKAKSNWTYVSKMDKMEIEGIIELWKEFLKDVPYETANKALNEHILKQGTFFPTVADLLKNTITTDEEIISEAVSKFRLCLKKGGAIKTDDRRLVWVISRMGGWEYVRRTEISKIDFVVKDFNKIYSEILKREVPKEIGFELLSNQAILAKENGTFFPIQTVISENKKELITT